MEFIKEGSTLPIPLNLIPTPSLFIYFYKKICILLRKKKQQNPQTENNFKIVNNGDVGDRISKGIKRSLNRKESIEGSELTYRVKQIFKNNLILYNTRLY